MLSNYRVYLLKITSNYSKKCFDKLKDPCASSYIDNCQAKCRPIKEIKLCPPGPIPLCPITDESRSKLRFWHNLTFFIALPSVIIMTIITMYNVKEENKKPRPEYRPMEYMYIRTKRFPWGDGNHTLFHNPERNPIPPNGYEVPDPNASKN
ncbi:hypothetical protein HCN44_007432 [Aphidius gifuensis]|uniref:Cytochrome c oxidase subunit n=1 Tax=Aphidius gifuensis TaxID=684658 RepID=A0A834XP80_APHGI|nr:uncharacterized protein LOC122856278 [Aphidius gifuensis]KAF7989122.1 hypothetical protein HCN44_007432 [Aphidius gifuensis]